MLFKKLRKGRKVLIRTIKFRCEKCGTIHELSDQTFNQREDPGIEDYSASASHSTLLCPNCHNNTFIVFPSYEWLYRKRCLRCNEMFETPFSWENKCKPCEHDFLMNMTKMGH